MVPLPFPAVLWIVSVCEENRDRKKKNKLQKNEVKHHTMSTQKQYLKILSEQELRLIHEVTVDF